MIPFNNVINDYISEHYMVDVKGKGYSKLLSEPSWLVLLSIDLILTWPYQAIERICPLDSIGTLYNFF